MTNNDLLTKKAIEMAFQDIANDPVKPMTKPISLTEVWAERKGEREWEALAPSTGYPDLDLIIKGFVPGHVYTVTGVENVGKTSISCNFACRVAKQGKKVLYYALEPGNQVIDYLASVRLDKRFDELNSDDLQFDDDMIKVFKNKDVNGIDDLVNYIQNTEEHYDLIIIDHIGYFVHDKAFFLQEQSNVVKKLAMLAKEKSTAIIIIAHLRKRNPNQKSDYVPTSDDISGSGAFKQDSTEVMIVVRKPKENDPDKLQYSNEGKLYVTKTKCGPNGTIGLIFSERKANIVSEGELLRLRNASAVTQRIMFSDEKEPELPDQPTQPELSETPELPETEEHKERVEMLGAHADIEASEPEALPF